MGRASNSSQAAATGAFASVFGARRGGANFAALASPSPTPASHAALRTLVERVRAGVYDDALAALAEHARLPTPPLVHELACAVSDQLVRDELESNDSGYRGFLQLTSVRTYWADQLIHTGGDDPVVHVWPDGARRGERVLGHEWASGGPVIVACGATLDARDVVRHVPRGAWVSPAYGKEPGRHWRMRRCSACEPAAGDVDDCAEHPDRVPLLAPARLQLTQGRAREAMTEKLLRRAKAGTPALPKLQDDAEHAVIEQLTEYTAEQLAADGDLAMARLFGYPSGFSHFPSVSAWETLLKRYRPMKRNRALYMKVPQSGGQSLLERFQGDVKLALVKLNDVA